MFVNISRIPYVTAPLFIIHGVNDQVVPFWHGKELERVAKNSKLLKFREVNAGHNDIEFTYSDEYSAWLAEFTQQALDIEGPHQPLSFSWFSGFNSSHLN
jgi:fermentation-respiration switch protein FrsA (DUF1100 family)